jgi:hypothetical protein
MSSGIIGIQRLYCFLLAYVTIWESFHVIRNYWNTACVLLLISILTIWASFYVIWNYWNPAFVLFFTSICNDMGVILCHPELLEYSVCIAVC